MRPPFFISRAAAAGQMYTSPSSVPSGWGSAYAITSVRPRWPVARRFKRRMSTPDSSVMSTRESGAPSHAKTRRATRARRSAPRCRLPGRPNAATGLRIVDAVVVHPAENDEECRLHLLDLVQREWRFVELAGADLGAHDVVDRLFYLLRREVVEHPQRRLHGVGDHRDGGFHGAGFGTGVGKVIRVPRLAAVGLLGLVGEVGDFGRAVMLGDEGGHGIGQVCLGRER